MDRIGIAAVFCSLAVVGCEDPTLFQPAPRTMFADSVDLKLDDSVIPALKAGRPFVDPRDGKPYSTVSIGDTGFVWMAQNLDFDTLNGTRSWCSNGSARDCGLGGRLYAWQIAMRAKDSGILNYCEVNLPDRGICPLGWHLPSLAEWDSAFESLGGIDRAGRALKSPQGWTRSLYGISGGGISSQFGALPTGYHFTGNQGFGHYGHTPTDSAFYDLGVSAYFWSRSFAMPGTCTNAWAIHLSGQSSRCDSVPLPRSSALAVRCVRDAR